MTPRIHVARDSDNHRRRTRTALAVVTFALALPALVLGLATPTDSDIDSQSIMVVRYACMACQHGCSADSYFTTYQAAAVHYANSARCNQSVRGIATVVLPSRASDVEAGGSGAAEAWAGPPRRGGPVRRQRMGAQAGGDIMLIHHTSQKLIMISRNHYILKTMISRNHYIMFLPIFHAISWVFEDFMVPRNLELYDIII